MAVALRSLQAFEGDWLMYEVQVLNELTTFFETLGFQTHACMFGVLKHHLFYIIRILLNARL